MPDSFFQSDKKRKRPSRSGINAASDRAGPSRRGRPGKVAPPKRQAADDELSSADEETGEAVDEMDFREGRGDADMSDEEILDSRETAAEKRIRLAKGYLAKVREELEAERETGDYDAAEIDRDLIASRLQQDVDESLGRITTFLSSHLTTPHTHFLALPQHRPTGVALTSGSIYVSTKRGLVFRYALPSLTRVGVPFGQIKPGKAVVEGHKGDVLAIAATEDDRYVLTGGRDKVIGVWEVEGEEVRWKAAMKGHKDAVTVGENFLRVSPAAHGEKGSANQQSISIPPLDNPSNHFLSASLSRHLTLHSISTLSALDSFFGHQDSIPSVSSLKPQVAVTAGSRDRTCRWWKVEEEVQLVLRGGGRSLVRPPSDDASVKDAPEERGRTGKGEKAEEYVEGSVDVVCMLDDQHFVSGGDSGAICLWNTAKKKPIFTQHFAHGIEEVVSEGIIQKSPRWITSLAGLRGTDLFVSGSYDGHVRLWSIDPNLRSFSPVSSIPIKGIITALQILTLPRKAVDPTQWPGQHHLPTPPADDADAAGQKKRRDRGKEIMLAASVSSEPRLGRWMTVKKGVQNGVLVAHLVLDEQGKNML